MIRVIRVITVITVIGVIGVIRVIRESERETLRKLHVLIKQYSGGYYS